jgi:CrcB protein
MRATVEKTSTMIGNFVLVGLGGALGVAARFGLVTWLKDWLVLRWGSGDKASILNFPVGSLLASILGCFLMGLITEWAGTRLGFSEGLKLFLVTGFCGGFAALAPVLLDANGLFRDGQWLAGGIFLGLSMALPLLAVIAGLTLAKA